MKNLNRILAALAAGTALIGGAQAANAADIEIRLTNVRPLQGQIHVGLYDEAGYGGGEASGKLVLDVDAHAISGVISDAPPGRYALRLYHDVNGDGEMNVNALGIPGEPYAFSNNAPGRFGPPDWDAAAFDVGPDGAVQTIAFP